MHTIPLVFLFAVGLCLCENSEATQLKNPRRIGILFSGVPSSLSGLKDDFRKSLVERGWVEGHNIIIEERYGGGKEDRLFEIAKELVSIKTDVIVCNSTYAARAAMAATNIIPIIAIGYPVGDGLVTNPVKPEANVTGLMVTEPPQTSGKRLELLRQAVPSVRRIAVLVPDIPRRAQNLQHTQKTARVLGISVQTIVLERHYIKAALSKMINPQALLILPWATGIRESWEILNYATNMRLPTVFTRRHFVVQGGFMSYGPVRTDAWKRAASFVDKLLKGISPAELPVERPLHYEFVINLKTANSFGLTVAPELLLQANEVIK